MLLPKVITFSGLDGAGKSTVINALKEKLEQDGLSVKVFTMYHDLSLYAHVRLFRDGIRNFFGKVVELPKEAKTNPNFDLYSDSLVYKAIRFKPLKAMVLPVDTLLTYLFLLINTKNIDIVLIDRTSYDFILDVIPTKYKKMHISIALFFSFKPSLSVFVDTPAQISFDRKGEYTVKYLDWRNAAYVQLFSVLDNQIVIDNYNNSVEHNVDVLFEKSKSLKK
jgi:thymidylate kinase